MTIAARSRLIASLLGSTLALSLASAYAADDPFVGTWVLDPAKSKTAGAAPTTSTIVVSDAGGGRHKTVTDMTMGGASVHNEITFAADGRDYSPTTTPAPPAGGPQITESFERLSESAVKATLKLNGTPVATLLNEVSKDGKTLTVTTTGAGAAASLSSVLVYARK